MRSGRAGDIPLVWVEPEAAARRTLVIWLPGFSGTKEMMQPYLADLAAYRHTPAISFQNGGEDRQVPPDGSQRFVAALRRQVYARCPERLDVTLHDGVAHEFTDAGWANALVWFRRHLAP